MQVIKYLDQALEPLREFSITPVKNQNYHMAELLQDLYEDLPDASRDKVTNLAMILQHEDTFNDLARKQIGAMKIGTRYKEITHEFDQVRSDAQHLRDQLADDGEITWDERIYNRLRAAVVGSIEDRFENVIDIYDEVAADQRGNLERNQKVLDGYTMFRAAYGEGQVLASEIKDEVSAELGKAQEAYSAAYSAWEAEPEGTEKIKLRNERDAAKRFLDQQESNLDLIVDIVSNMERGHILGESIADNYKTTQDLNDKIYRRGVTFMSTNKHVFTLMAGEYSNQLALDEGTKVLESLSGGLEKSFEDLAQTTPGIRKKALRQIYGPRINADSFDTFVTSTIEYERTQDAEIETLTAEAKAQDQKMDDIWQERVAAAKAINDKRIARLRLTAK